MGYNITFTGWYVAMFLKSLNAIKDYRCVDLRSLSLLSEDSIFKICDGIKSGLTRKMIEDRS